MHILIFQDISQCHLFFPKYPENWSTFYEESKMCTQGTCIVWLWPM